MNGYLDLIAPPDEAQATADNGPLRLARTDEGSWEGAGVVVSASRCGDGLVVAVTATGPVSNVVLRWRRPTPLAIRVLSDTWERAYGDLGWRGLAPDTPMPWYFLTHNGALTHGYGVQTGAGALCSWRLDPRGVTLQLDLRCGGRDLLLGGRELVAAVVVARRGLPDETPAAAARGFVRHLCPQPLLPAWPVYGGNNWYYAYGWSSAEAIRRDSHALGELAPDRENRPFSVIDAGWQFRGDCEGAPWAGNLRFPDMAALAGEIRAAGCRPGIWLRPLLTCEALPQHWTLPPRPFAPTHAGAVIDPTVPEALAHLQADVRRLVAWGYELIKHDFSTHDLLGQWGNLMGDQPTAGGWSFHDRGVTTAEAIRRLYAAIHAAAGEALVIGCNTVGHLIAGHAHLQRIGQDTSGHHWAQTRQMGVNSLGFRFAQHDALFAIDADCVGVTPNIPWTLNRRWLALLAGSGTPLFVSLHPDALGAQQRHELRQAFAQAARPQPLAEPLDWLDTTCPSAWRVGDTTQLFNWFDL